MRIFMTTRIQGVAVFLAVWLLVFPSLTAPAHGASEGAEVQGVEPAEKPSGVTGQPSSPQATAEQLARINGSSNVDELLAMARQYVLSQQYSAAGATVERIVGLQGNMLADSERQSPSSFNEFWFIYRAEMRLKKLAAKDIAGWLEVAQWLHTAGFLSDARDLLEDALTMDPNSSQARELAEKWHFYGGGPVQFDLTLVLNRPLFAQSLKDENEEITVRKDRTLFILPIAYQCDGGKQSISKTSVKVTADGKMLCPTKGLILLETSLQNSAMNAAGLTQAIPDRLQNDSEPFWERIQIEPASVQRGGSIEEARVVCFNTTPPMVGRDRRSRDRSNQNATKEMPASGFAAFVIEIPIDTKQLNCEYRGITHTRIDLELLRQMSKSQAEVPQEQWAQLATTLARCTGVHDSVIASLAVAKLAMMRSSLQSDSGTTTEKQSSSKLQEQIDKAIMKALLHPSQQVCQQALLAIVQSKSNFDTVAFQSLVLKDTVILENILDQVATTLDHLAQTRLGTVSSNTEAKGYNPEEMRKLLSEFPDSSAPWNLFALLMCCMNSGNEQAAERAVDIALEFPSQQTIFILATATGVPRQVLLKRLESIPDEKFRMIMLRLLLVTPDPENSAALLTALEATSLQITDADDPLLLALGRMDAANMPRMMKLLARSDLSAMTQNPEFSKKIDDLLNNPQTAAVYRPVLVQLALLQVQQGYQASVKRTVSNNEKSNVFEELLAKTAASDPTSPLGKQAAVALLTTGRADVLNKAVVSAPESVRAQLINDFMADTSLRSEDALAYFLACRVNDTEPTIKAKALPQLARLIKDSKNLWRVNLAIKQALDISSLTSMANKSDTVSRQAVDLVLQLAQANSGERDQIASATPTERASRLSSLVIQRASKLMGVYACMVYLDVAPMEEPKDNQGGSDSSTEPNLLARLRGRGNLQTEMNTRSRLGRLDKNKAPTTNESADELPQLVARRNIPLLAVPKLIIEVRDNTIRVNSDVVGFTVKSSNANLLHVPDAMMFIKAALASKDAKAEGLTETVIALPRDVRECDFQHEQVGTWSSEIRFDTTASSSIERRPLHITGAKIILEPMLP